MKLLIIVIVLIAYLLTFGWVSDYFNNAAWVNYTGIAVGGLLLLFLVNVINKYSEK